MNLCSNSHTSGITAHAQYVPRKHTEQVAGVCVASSPGSLHGFTGNTGGRAARKKESLVRTVRACANLIAENT